MINTIQEHNLVERAASAGARLRGSLERVLNGQNCVVEIRGRGLMVGIELDRPCAELVAMALERGVLINVTADCVVRLLPPLVVSDGQIDEIAATVGDVIKLWNSGGAAAV